MTPSEGCPDAPEVLPGTNSFAAKKAVDIFMLCNYIGYQYTDKGRTIFYENTCHRKQLF